LHTRRALERLADWITLALLYGSVVQDGDTAASDVDLLIVAEGVTPAEGNSRACWAQPSPT
jgi:predicted nucleotidyltransferase